MAVVVRRGPENPGRTILLVVLITITILVLFLVVYYYVILPYRRLAASNTATTVRCDEAPSAPTGVAGAASGNSAVITWSQTPVTDSYRVYMGRVSGFTKASAERTIPSNTNSVTVVNLVPDTYFFVVTAVNTCGESTTSSQVSVTTTTWPATLKLCKADNPLLCLLLPPNPAQIARVSTACPANGCNIDYISQNRFALSPDAAVCLQSNFIANPNIENDVFMQICSGAANQTWTIDLNTQRVTNPQGLCLGADDVAESFAFNTDCNLLQVGDARYLWTPQPI